MNLSTALYATGIACMALGANRLESVHKKQAACLIGIGVISLIASGQIRQGQEQLLIPVMQLPSKAAVCDRVDFIDFLRQS